MTWSFPGVSYPVEATYTQTVGFQADIALLRCLPQVGNLPFGGTLTLSWSPDTATLPDCIVDIGASNLSPDGRFLILKVKDRREWWKKAAPISGEYNTVRVGYYITERQRSLRQLGTLLMTALGEPFADVSALPTNVYPPVSWECADVVEAAQTLFEEHGYSVALGFDSEAVTVVQLGVGASLSDTYKFIGSDTIDPKEVPQYVRNCFRNSAAQVRLKLEPVGRDLDGSWVPIDYLSYAPGGSWGSTAPYSLPTLGEPSDADAREDQLEAVGYIRRAYRISGFADGTWNFPDGTGSVSGLTDILPIKNQLLEAEDLRADGTYVPFRVYGKYYMTEDETGQPPRPGGADTNIGDRVTGRRMQFDGENGMVLFDEPIYYSSGGVYYPADLWLECTIQVRNQTTFAWNHYEYDVEVDPTGTGYHTVRHENLRAETIVTYDGYHDVTGVYTNQTDLDAIGDAWAVAVAATYTATASQYKVYCIPRLALRCDGAILQIQHIITCGDRAHAANRSTASRNFEFDRGLPSRAARVAHIRGLTAGVAIHEQARIRIRKENADD